MKNLSLRWDHSQGLQALGMLGTGIWALRLLCCQRNFVEGAVAPFELLHGRGEVCHAACVGRQTVAQAQPGREHVGEMTLVTASYVKIYVFFFIPSASET